MEFIVREMRSGALQQDGSGKATRCSDAPSDRLRTAQSEPNAAMDGSHVVVNLTASRERGETSPADVRLATCARHMVAASHALDRYLAAGAILDVVSQFPLLEQSFVLGVLVLARSALVKLHIAERTDPKETRWALEDGAGA